MKIRMYPDFNEVFSTDELLGVFYPLCSIDENLHFVSSNGLWLDEQYETEHNASEYTRFEIKNGKYDFKGDIRLYKGYKCAKRIFPILENDFETNGKTYLQKKMKTGFYIEKTKKMLSALVMEDIDLGYYLQTFYEFNINKLNYGLNGKFGEFMHLINGRGKHESPIVYEEAEIRIYRVEETLQKKIDIIKNYSEIGTVIGYEFFTDGNDSVLYFNEKENKVLSINCYS